MIGKTVAHYEIEERIGRGGMGVVYRARDTRLGRHVALKFLPAQLTSDDHAKGRFTNEASTASALEHPNICTIHEIGESDDGQLFIAMALYEGRTLRQILGPADEMHALDPERAAHIASQIADGLSAAHDRGIIHRDIKPENIMVTGDDRVIILDFGIAKLAGATKITVEGTTPGTVAYMSPEQVRGGEVDHRSDIWSLGVVLYEMLTGRRPFGGEYDQAVIYSILNEAHDMSRVPAPFLMAIAMSLVKNPDERFASAAAFRDATLEAVADRPPEAGRSSTGRFVAVVAVVAAIALTALWMFGRFGSPADPGPTAGIPAMGAFEFNQLTFAAELEEYPAISPDSRRIVFSREVDGYRHLFIHDFETGEDRQLTSEPRDDIQAAWSPDGESIVFVRSNQRTGKMEPGDVFGEYDGGDIWKIELLTGRERRIAQEAFSPSFSPDGTQLAVDAFWGGARRIWLTDEEGRNARQLTSDVSEEVSHISPRWSPDGRRLVYQKIQRTKFDIELVDVTTSETISITDDAFQDVNPLFDRSGLGIFFSSYRSGGVNIWYVPLDVQGRPSSIPRQVSTGAGSDAQLTIARDGSMLAYSVLGINADLWRLPVDPATGMPAGPTEEIVATTREDSRGAWSHDDTRIAFNSDRTGHMNIWIHEIDSGSAKQVSSGAGGDYQPRWSPDDARLVFFSSRAGNADIWEVDIASGALSQLTTDESIDINPAYSPDGRRIAFLSDRGGRREVWLMNADGSEQRVMTSLGAGGHFVEWSADGADIIFQSSIGGEVSAVAVSVEGGEPRRLTVVRGGAHMSFDPNHHYIADVVGHKVIWITPLDSSPPYESFEFEDLDIRVDYPVLSHNGRWLLFDRVKPRGGDIWTVKLGRGQ